MQRKQLTPTQKQNCKQLFNMLDIDNLNQIPLSKIYSFFQKIDKRLTKKYCEELFFNFNTCQKRIVDLQGFQAMMEIVKGRTSQEFCYDL